MDETWKSYPLEIANGATNRQIALLAAVDYHAHKGSNSPYVDDVINTSKRFLAFLEANNG